MAEMNRRGFLGSVAAALPVAAASHRALKRTKPGTPGLDDELIRALGHAVLPAELGSDGIDRVVAGFHSWLEEYEPGAELNHGYGTADIEFTPDDPTTRWQSQLNELEREAQRQLQMSFVQLDSEGRRGIVRRQISGDRLDRLPRPYRARHVAVGLLAYFYSTPEATDLCYQAAIGKNNCRPLARSPQEPISLRRRG